MSSQQPFHLPEFQDPQHAQADTTVPVAHRIFRFISWGIFVFVFLTVFLIPHLGNDSSSGEINGTVSPPMTTNEGTRPGGIEGLELINLHADGIPAWASNITRVEQPDPGTLVIWIQPSGEPVGEALETCIPLLDHADFDQPTRVGITQDGSSLLASNVRGEEIEDYCHSIL